MANQIVVENPKTGETQPFLCLACQSEETYVINALSSDPSWGCHECGTVGLFADIEAYNAVVRPI